MNHCEEVKKRSMEEIIIKIFLMKKRNKTKQKEKKS